MAYAPGTWVENVTVIHAADLARIEAGIAANAAEPASHAASHASGGSDAVALAAAQITSGVLAVGRLATGTPDGTKFVRDDGTLATPAGGGGATVGTTAGTVAAGDDSRFSNAAAAIAANTIAITARAPLPVATLNPLTGWHHADGYGAITGSTGAAAAINAAVTAANTAGGGTVYIPFTGTGTVTVDAQIVLKSNVRLEIGNGVTLRRGTGFTSDNLIVNAAALTSRGVNDAVTNGTTTVTSATAAFTSGDVGANVILTGASTTAGSLTATIASVTNSTTAQLATAATGSGTALILNVYTSRDSNISLSGGVSTVIDGGTNNSTTGYKKHITRFRHVDHIDIRDLNIVSTLGKFAVNVGDVSDYVIDRITFPGAGTFSDGIHVNGPAYRGKISNIVGYTGDDFVAVIPNDWAGTNDVAGDVIGLSINDLHPISSAKSAVDLSGGLGCIMRKINIENVYGSTVYHGVTIGSDTSAQGHAETASGVLDDITVRNVQCKPGPGYETVTVGAIGGGHIVIDGIVFAPDSTDSTVRAAVYVNDGAVVSHLVVRNIAYDATQTTTVGAVVLGGTTAPSGCTIGHLEVDGVNFKHVGVGVPVVGMQGAPTCTEMSISRVYGNSAGSNAIVKTPNPGATVSQLSISDVHNNFTALNTGVTTSVVSYLALTRFMQNRVGFVPAWIADVNCTIKVSIAACSFQGSGTFTIRAAGAVEVYSDGSYIGGFACSIVAGGSLRTYSPNFPIDIATANFAAFGGMQARNINAANLGGAGPMVTDSLGVWRSVGRPLANGTVALVAGTVTVSLATLTGNHRIRLSTVTPGGTPGALFVSSRTNGVGFTVTSTSAADTSTVYWETA